MQAKPNFVNVLTESELKDFMEWSQFPFFELRDFKNQIERRKGQAGEVYTVMSFTVFWKGHYRLKIR
jgi:hypothetical protein